jgi:hypothetical protein
VVGQAATIAANDSDSMRFIEKEQRAESFLERDYFRTTGTSHRPC